MGQEGLVGIHVRVETYERGRESKGRIGVLRQARQREELGWLWARRLTGGSTWLISSRCEMDARRKWSSGATNPIESCEGSNLWRPRRLVTVDSKSGT